MLDMEKQKFVEKEILIFRVRIGLIITEVGLVRKNSKKNSYILLRWWSSLFEGFRVRVRVMS